MKRVTIWLAAAAVTVLLLAQGAGAAEKSQPEKLTTLTVAELRSEFWLPAYLAETLGFYKEEGLKVRFITTKDGPVAFQGMHAGSADLTMLSTEPVFRAQAKGLESIIFMALLTNKPYMFVGSPAIKDVKQLKGKTIFAGAPGSAPHSFALSILEKAGMKDTDVNWAQMEYGASLAALEKGHIEASYIRSTAKKEIAAVGANILVDVSDPVQHKEIYGTSRYESTIVTGTRKFVRENPETIQKFANAVVRAMIWLNENSNEAAAEKALPMFPAGNMGAESIGFLRPSLSLDGLITPEGHQTIVSFCRAEGIIDRDIPYDEINDMSFVQKAYEKYK
jgi:NitT/TauT family transport system substrate-binding protein